MKDSSVVDMLHAQADLKEEAPDRILVEDLTPLLLHFNRIVQISSVRVLHNNVQILLIDERLFVGDDIRVVQLLQNFRLK